MFDDLFKNLTGLIVSKVGEAFKEIEKHLAIPEPTEPFTLIHQFAIAEPTITKGGIALVGESWRIEAYDDNSSRLNMTIPCGKLFYLRFPNQRTRNAYLLVDFKPRH